MGRLRSPLFVSGRGVWSMADLYEFAFFVIGAACSWAIFSRW